MFINRSSPTPTSSSTNNNNSNQPNPNYQPNIFSVPTNSFGSLPPQPSGDLFSNQIQQQSQVESMFSNQVQQPPTGGFFGSTQPSGGLFGNQSQGGSFLNSQIQLQTGGFLGGPQSSGGLFNNQVQQQAQGGSLFGNPYQQSGGILDHPSFPGMRGGFDASQMHTFVSRTSIPLNGTVDYIGSNNVQNLRKNRDGHLICSMTARITGYTLDEQRMADYYNLKNNTLNIDDKRMVFSAVSNRINPPGAHDQFLTAIPPILKGICCDPNLFINMMNSQPSPLLGSQTSGSLFMNPQSSQIIPSPLMTNNFPSNTLPNQPSVIQSSSLPIQTPMLSNNAVPGQSNMKGLSVKSEKKSLESNPGSFSYEFNKMLFVSSLVQIMEKHNMTVPENLLDNTDFVPQLLAFLEQHNINLPTENVPQFQIDSTHLLSELKDENNE